MPRTKPYPQPMSSLHSDSRKLGGAAMDQTDAAAVDGELLPDPLPGDPFPLFREWFDLAQQRHEQPNPNAMTLATIGPDGHPAARIVLCKGIDVASSHIVFYTNEQGRKGRELLATPRAAVVFHWDHQDRQVRIEGRIAQSPKHESDAYFATRAWLSRIGAWSSDQSQPIATRAELEQKVHTTMRRFGIDPDHPPAKNADIEIPRPPHWGGFRLYAERVEFWCAGSGRLHDRAAWTRTLRVAPPDADVAFLAGSHWASVRLQP
jgi:pyridoxamine 5'-phosphate oxidase